MMVKIKDIAEKAGVSTATVSLALHGGSGRKRVSVKLAEMIRSIAESLNYRPNSAARMMSSKRTMQIGVLLRNAPDIPKRNPANFETILGIGDYLSEKNYIQVLVPLSKLTEEISASSRIFSEQLIDGIIVMDVLASRVYAFVRRNFRHSVFLETNYWNKFSCMRRDEKKAGAMAAEAMLKSGYKRILYVEPGQGKSSHFSVLERFTGVMAAADGKIEIETVNVNAIEDVLFRVPCLTADLGIICYDSLIARYVHSCLSQAGFSPPADYGLVSCDDSHETELTFPALSRVDNNRYEIGRLAARMLIDSIETPGRAIPSSLFDVSWIHGTTIQ